MAERNPRIEVFEIGNRQKVIHTMKLQSSSRNYADRVERGFVQKIDFERFDYEVMDVDPVPPEKDEEP